jgi:hypothetical protein
LSGVDGIYAPSGSRARRFAEAVAWLWRLGPVRDSPDTTLIGLGWQDESAELDRLLRAGSLGGAVVFATRPGPREGRLPGRARRIGAPSFGPECRVFGQFSILDAEAEPVVESPIGVHAVRDGSWMVVGADPDGSWGALDSFWVFDALADFMADVLDRPLAMLPPVGWARYDDVPGTAFQQLAGKQKSDGKMRRRVESIVKRLAEVDARLNVAIAPRALVDGREVPVDEVWPTAVAAIKHGIELGFLEPVCHGYLHLDTAAWAEGKLSAREFAQVGRAEAERRLDVALEWFAGRFGEPPRTFVAPTWAYSEGLLDALAEREVPTWLPPDPGPLVVANTARETVFSTMEGMVGLDYRPLERLAAVGLPPSVIVHGGLFDSRVEGLLDPRQLGVTARLARRRDLFRIPWVDNVRWIGAGELIDRLRRHDQVVVSGASLDGPPGTEVVVRDSAGSRTCLLGADSPTYRHK